VRRPGWMLAGVMVLLLLPLTVPGCSITCACTSPPDPNWTPPPMTAQEATAAIAEFASGRAGAPLNGPEAWLSYSRTDAAQNHPLYIVNGPTVGAAVDAQSGTVIALVVVESLPNSNDVLVASDKAREAAASFLSDRGRDTTGRVATIALGSGGATSVYFVSWAGKGSDAADLSVSVNPSSGMPFAFIDGRSGVAVVPPCIGAEGAGRLAIAAVSTPGQVVVSADFRFDLEHPSWDISLALPNPTASAAPEHGVFVSVDAVSGATTVGKDF
jgi:hypothetical protein